MKAKIGSKRILSVFFLWIGIMCSINTLHSQCNNNLYALSPAGVIYSVNTSTTVLTAISNTAPSALVSNAMAYKGVTNTFYFFANSQAGSAVFESFVPGVVPPAGVFTTLSMVNGPTGTVNTACISTDGNGYYCLDSHGYIYYYNILTNTWNTVATTIKDQSGTDITASIMAPYSSGDMAFDGNGNLWLLVGNSSTNKYGLYEVVSPVPNTNVGTITGKQIVATGSSLADNSCPVGIAFNATGAMYISTLSNDLYIWTTIFTTPVLKGTFSTNIFDMASCSMPTSALPVHFTSLTAKMNSKAEVQIAWKAMQMNNTDNYSIEHSIDGIHWTSIGTMPSNLMQDEAAYSFIDLHPANGDNYYRIKETDRTGEYFYSGITKLKVQNNTIRLWPNPVNDILNIDNNGKETLTAKIISVSGNMVSLQDLHPGTNAVNLSQISSGSYIIQVQTGYSPYNRLFIKK
ncbi:MAG: T9SS type A sorting domain-containing protein [Flavisolibacter sp.]